MDGDLKYGGGPVESCVAAQASSEGWNEHSSCRQVVEEVGAFDEQQVQLVAVGDGLVERDSPESNRLRKALVDHSSSWKDL